MNERDSQPNDENSLTTDLTRRVEVLREVDAWFPARGFGLLLTEEDNEYWAHLVPKDFFFPALGWVIDPSWAA